MKRAIIFDFDGTLLNTMPIFDSIVRQQLKNRGVLLSKEKEQDLIDKYLNKLADIEFGRGRRAVIKVFSQIGKACDLGYVKRGIFIFNTIRGIMRSYNTANFFPDSQRVLSSLRDKDYSLAIVTMASKKDINRSIGNLRQYFEVIVTRDDVKQIKPAPEGLEKACRILNVGTNNCYSIGDLPLDIIAAERAGIIALAVTTGISSEDLLKKFSPQAIFHSLTEAYEWIVCRDSSHN